MFTGLAVPYSLLLWLSPNGSAATAGVLGAGVAGAGVAGVACSVLIYTTTHRASWRPVTVGAKFGLTAAAGGLATVMWASSVAAVFGGGSRIPGGALLLVLMAIVTTVKLGAEAAWMRRPHPQLRQTIVRRYALGLVGGVALPLLLAATMDSPNWLGVAVATLAIISLVAGEYLERSLFFTTASPPR